jgi:hypothetical protein
MRASFFAFACLAIVGCSGSSSNDVLGPNGSPASSSTSSDTNQTTPPPKNDPNAPGDPNNPSTDDPTEPTQPTKPPTTTSPPPATAAECDAFAAKFCAKASACDSLLAKIVGTDCSDRMSNMCKAHLSAPGTGFTSAALTACGNVYGSTTTCEDAFGAAQASACSIKGSLALNAKCAFADQCASGYCTGTAENECGVCATPPSYPTPTYAGFGEACDPVGSGAKCNTALGHWCDSGTKTCEEIGLAAIGEPCGFVDTDMVMCSAGGTCKWDSGTGTCVAEKAIGASCTAASGYEECTIGATCIAGKCAYPTAAAICK